MRIWIAAALLSLPGMAHAQARPPACADTAIRFEFQVTMNGGELARWIVDTTVSVRPTPRVPSPANIVQFAVDTLGLPIPWSFRVLRIADSSLIAETRRSVALWRFHPATVNGCVVRQLVQTPVSMPATGQPRVASNDVLIRVRPLAGGSVTLADFQPDLPAVEGPFECTGREVFDPNMIAVYAHFPNASDSKATVVVFVDSTGKMVRYAERRGPPIRPAVPPGLESRATAAQVAAAAGAVRSTTINLSYERGVANVANRGGGQPDQFASGSIGLVGPIDKFGRPFDRAARVLIQCEVKR